MKYFPLIVILFCLACDPAEVDVTAPEIDNIVLTPAPGTALVCGTSEGQAIEITGGELLQFDAIFRDEVDLSQYKIDIHSNFDCHGHGNGAAPSIAVPDVSGQTEDWAVLEIKDLTGTSQNIARELLVPENVTAGNYHFQVQVIDAAGNDDPLANIYTLKITNPTDIVAPTMEAVEPRENSFSAIKGSNIQFKGLVKDETSLSIGGNGVLFLSYTNLSTGNTFNTDAIFPFDTEVDIRYDFDFEWQVPNTLTAGTYQLTLGATDGVRNVANFLNFEVMIE